MANFRFHSEPLQAGWVDAYGHLNEAYYLVPFSNASWAMQEHFGIGVEYFKRTGCALYTLETHLRYVAEVRVAVGTELGVETMVIGADAKRLWFAHLLVVEGEVRATGEFMGLHYDTGKKGSAVFSEAVATRLAEATVGERPGWVGRRIGFGG